MIDLTAHYIYYIAYIIYIERTPSNTADVIRLSTPNCSRTKNSPITINNLIKITGSDKDKNSNKRNY